MATLRYDEQSLILDNRRIWISAGAVHYARIPRPAWPDAIRAAAEAGLNTITVDVPWALHEPEAETYNFEGQADLRAFVKLIQEQDLHCILRPGPGVGGGLELGGVPAWLSAMENMRIRSDDPRFLEAAARYYGAVMGQIVDLQWTPPNRSGPAGKVEGGGHGPILLVQAENGWFSRNPEQEIPYHRELVSYLHQNGCTVPITICNNLWQPVEDTLETWTTDERILSDLRQLRTVQPNFPPLLTDLSTTTDEAWNDGKGKALPTGDTLARLAEALAAGGQFSINPFYGGSAGGFLTGRRPTADGTWLTGAFDHAAPITEAGETTDTARTIKRIATFATQFASLLAHADLDASHHAALAPEEDPKGLSVIHHRGPQGNPVFFIRGKKHDAKQTSLLLPNGVTLPIPLGNDRAAWVALNAPLTTDAELSWTNLRPWAFLEDRLLVLFGPAGADGIVAINEAPLEIDVPRGKTPAVVEHEGVTIAVLNTEQVDAAVIGPEGLLIGADGLDADDQPRPLKGYRRATLVTPDGQTLTRTTGDTPRAGRAPSLSGWQQARVLDKIDGEDAAYDTLDGPTPLGAIDATSHYAWYRLQIKNVDTKTVMAPGAGDRLHVFQDGKLKTILGEGPHGQRGPLKLPLEGTTTILADTPGRFVSGWRQNEPKGLYDHIYGVEETDMGKPERTTGSAPDPFVAEPFLPGLRRGEPLMADRITWSFSHKSTRPILVDIDGLDTPAVLATNDEAFGVYDPEQSAGAVRFTLLSGEQLKRGNNTLTVALIGREKPITLKQLKKHLKVYTTTDNLTANASWGVAPFAPPADDAFGRIVKSAGMLPCWYRCEFESPSTTLPLWLEPRGLSKGQIYLNGHHLGGYWQATHTGREIGPRKRILLPHGWLNDDEPNQLMLFDEHGKTPDKARLKIASSA